ncbi:hypothetical protein V3481_014316 [Fusarium oxysporum f. sp. vasinfectum]|jgi:hypothetical protein
MQRRLFCHDDKIGLIIPFLMPSLFSSGPGSGPSFYLDSDYSLQGPRLHLARVIEIYNRSDLRPHGLPALSERLLGFSSLGARHDIHAPLAIMSHIMKTVFADIGRKLPCVSQLRLAGLTSTNNAANSIDAMQCDGDGDGTEDRLQLFVYRA